MNELRPLEVARIRRARRHQDDGRIEAREYLALTASIDHDIVDGAPAARFASRLRELIEDAEVLQDVAR